MELCTPHPAHSAGSASTSSSSSSASTAQVVSALHAAPLFDHVSAAVQARVKRWAAVAFAALPATPPPEEEESWHEVRSGFAELELYWKWAKLALPELTQVCCVHPQASELSSN